MRERKKEREREIERFITWREKEIIYKEMTRVRERQL